VSRLARAPVRDLVDRHEADLAAANRGRSNMPRMLTAAAALCLGVLSLAWTPASAQQNSTDEDRTVRPGDRIEWSAPPPERVQFGGVVGTPPVELTPMSDIAKILEFSSPLNFLSNTAASRVGGSPMLVATVKDGAATSGVRSFTFTSGQHPTEMFSQPFFIAAPNGQPPRTLKIKAVGLEWVLERSGGPASVTRR
jgi:hypothetical protein